MDLLEIIKELHKAGLTGPLLAGTVVVIIIVLNFKGFMNSFGDLMLKRKEARQAHELALRELDADIDFRKHQQIERATFLPHEPPKQITHAVAELMPQPDLPRPKRRTRARKP